MSGKAIRSSYTIDGLLGLNRQDEHKHRGAKPEQVIDEATHKPDHSTRLNREQGTVSLRRFTALLTRLAPKTLRHFTNKAGKWTGRTSHFHMPKFYFSCRWYVAPVNQGGLHQYFEYFHEISWCFLNFNPLCDLTGTRELWANFGFHILRLQKTKNISATMISLWCWRLVLIVIQALNTNHLNFINLIFTLFYSF